MSVTLIDNVGIEEVMQSQNAEQRLSVKLLHYWNSIRKERLFPHEDSINAEDIPDIWEHCYLIQVNDLEHRQKVDFTYLGRKIIEAYHGSLAESDMVDIISPKSSRIVPNFRLVIEEKKPILQSGEFRGGAGKLIKFRQCMLPLGASDARVEAVFGCVGFRIYH